MALTVGSVARKLEGVKQYRSKTTMETTRYSAGRVWLRRLSYQYLNAYAAGLLVAVGVSILANFGHAVEFAQDFAAPGIGIKNEVFS